MGQLWENVVSTCMSYRLKTFRTDMLTGAVRALRDQQVLDRAGSDLEFSTVNVLDGKNVSGGLRLRVKSEFDGISGNATLHLTRVPQHRWIVGHLQTKCANCKR